MIEATEHNDDAERVLRIIGGDLNRVSMYKVVEIVKKHCGGEAGIANAGWATKKEVNLFTHTANSVGALGDRARHGLATGQAPATPMRERDAVALVLRLAQRWLQSLVILREMYEVGGEIHARYVDVVTESEIPSLMLRYREAARALRTACDQGAGELSKIVDEQRMRQEKLDRGL